MSERGNEQVGVGIVGCGVISDIYLKNCTTRYESVRVVGCADLVVERAREQASKYGVEALTVDELLSHPEVELVLNLTVPAAHAEVALAAVASGKSIYNEKPLTVSAEDGRTLLEQAAAKGVRVGAAPDTFLGGGLQTVRGLLDGGAIGEPVAAAIAFYSHGMENWHRDPYFFFQPGAGPLFDMGPYYLTALTSMLGPVRRVAATARASFPERRITSESKRGQKIPVNTPTHIVATLDFAAGPLASLAASFDVWETTHATLVIYGSEGTLALPDPNTFGGPVRLLRAGGKEWEEQPLTHDFTDNSRGIGVADMASAMREGRPHRASGEMAYHVLEVMHGCLESSLAGQHIELESRFDRPAALPRD
ncbi:MAG: Gfo/Idh/MocA family oxidoreductase [Chloroflexia bacterium]|nr:Gfo/Idh/MocA family oxidoreductase [Chloroflexia bacterium]